MQVIILAGGFGTRLKLVVKDVPKPMANISGKPFLSYLLTHLKNFGATDVVLSVGYLQEKIIEHFGDSFLGIKISYAKEENPLGTGGAIVNSLKFIDKNKPVVVVNGDTFLQINYQNLLKFFAEKKSRLTLVLLKMEDCRRYGRILIDENFLIQNFEEKSGEQKSGFINGGIYVLDPKIFNEFSIAKSFSFESDFLIKYLKNLEPQGFLVDEYFVDIGISSDYDKAKNELPNLIKNKAFILSEYDTVAQATPHLVGNPVAHVNATPKKNKALFLDRDGVINVDYGHVFEIQKFHFVEGIFEFCKLAQSLGYLLIVVTNQAGIAKGFYSEEQFLELTKWMENEFEKRGIKITKTFYCPYHASAKIEKYRQDSFDRKPNCGMILKAIEEFNIDPTKSVMIGDKESDIEAAKKAGIAKTLLLSCEKNFSAAKKLCKKNSKK